MHVEYEHRSFAMAGARNITDYNLRIEQGKVEGDQLPYILVIVDELADLHPADIAAALAPLEGIVDLKCLPEIAFDLVGGHLRAGSERRRGRALPVLTRSAGGQRHP